MKKFLLSAFSCLLTLSVSATGLIKPLATPQATNQPYASSASVSMNNLLLSLYDDRNYKVPNFYIIFASDENAKYNDKTGFIDAPAGSFTFIIDCYNYCPDDGVYLPEGTYTMMKDDENERPRGYTHEFSMLNYYDAKVGQISVQLENPVEVTRTEDGYYTVTTTVEDGGGNIINVTYNGPIKFGSSTEKPTVYPQIKHDITVDLDKGGISYYQGVTDASSQGVSFLDLYDVDFDENGIMAGEGYSLCMMIAHKRFTKRADYAVCPGTYTNSNTLARNTWYPGREIDYMGYVMYFGSYIRQLQIVDGQREYTYAYLQTGEFTIEDNGDGTYKGTLNAISDLGYHVNVTWSGAIALNTENATFQATVSDLTDDVEMDFSPLPKGRIYHSGIQGGCRTLIVDLGSPSGKDPEINEGGDLLRMEFLVDPKEHLLQPGLYTVVPRRWNSNELHAGGMYEPMSLNKGYFDAQGAQIGTRYAHFRPGSWCVYDMVGPAEEGTVRVETQDYQNYTFIIDLKDDAGFMMTGLWDNKPIEYCYNAEALQAEIGSSGIESATSDSAIRVILEGSNIFVINAGNAPIAIYSIDGRQLVNTTADKMIPVSDLGKGIFIVKVNNTSIKISL